MKFSIKDFFSKCDQIRMRIWSYLLKKSLMENFKFLGSVTCVYLLKSSSSKTFKMKKPVLKLIMTITASERSWFVTVLLKEFI